MFIAAITIVSFLTFASNLISICSVLHLLLPAYEIFDEYPNFKKYYKLIVLVVGNIALNKREGMVNLYPSARDKNAG